MCVAFSSFQHLGHQNQTHVPLDPENNNSSVASKHNTGLVCPSATEMHCSGAVRALLEPPTGLMIPLAWEKTKQLKECKYLV